ATLTATSPGTATITGTLAGTDITDEETVVVTVGAASVGHTTATVGAGTAGEETTITVTVLDEYDNPVAGASTDLSGSIIGDNTSTLTFVAGTAPGTYKAVYTPTKSGMDNIAITLNGDAISGSPYSSEIIGGPIAKLAISTQPSATTRSGMVFGQQPTIELLDAFDNPAGPRTGRTVLYAAIKSGNGALDGTAATRLLSDTESWSFTDLGITGEAGIYELEFSISTTSATTIPAVTSNAITLIAGAPDASTTTAVVTPGTAGETTTITIIIRDSEGNPVSDVSLDDIDLNIDGANTGAEVGDIVDNGDGTYSVTYVPTRAGEDEIHIALGGAAINGSPYNSTVSPNTATQLVFIEHPVAGASGEIFATQPLIEIRDAYGNVITSDNDTEVTVAIAAGNGGTLTGATTLVATSGIITFTDIALSGIVGETYVLNFTANPALTSAPSKVMVAGHGTAAQLELVASTADLASGNTRQLTATLKDNAGNTITTGIESTLQIVFAQQSGDGSITGLSAATTNGGTVQLTITGEKAGNVTLVASTATPTLESNTLAFLVTVDKSALQTAVGEVDGLVETDYTPASWDDLQEAVNTAQVVLDNPTATQAAVDAALEQLNNAIANLSAGSSLAAPTAVVAQAGDEQVQLTWKVPENTDGAPITDYVIQYTTDNGATWHTIDDGISTATETTLTGLTNNVPYRLRVAAVNAAGTGAFSAATPVVVPSIPVPDETGELPTPQPGETVVIVDGQPENVTLEVIDNSYLRLSGDGFAMDLASIGINDQLIPITDVEAVIRIIRGEGASVRVTGYGFEPGTVITLYVFSEPQLLGHIPVQENGTFEGTLAIPADLELGRHTLQANGVVRNTREERSVSIGVLVVEELEQQIAFAPIPDKTYGDKEIILQGTATSGLSVSYRITDVQGNDTDIAEIVDGNRVRINGAGTVQVIASQAGAGIYGAAEDVVRTLAIQPATLSVSVQAVDRPFGEANPAFELHYSGFENEDTEQDLEQAPVATTAATPSSDVGNYPITISGGKSANYVFKYNETTLTVTRAHQQIEFDAPDELDRSVGRVPLDVLASSGLSVTLTLDDEQVAKLDGNTLDVLRVGTVTITATQEGNANYYPAEPVSVTIQVTDGSDFPVRVHKAVSPNGDGINEFLMIEGIRDYPENRVTIINKNGTVLFEVSGYDNANKVFRGVSTGQLQLPAGTYFYIVEIKENGEWRAQKGYFVMRY
ncbi:MAG TPA: filamin/ABP280 repeat domain-containing protein, partial [Parapedobacter sp.]|uniref:filamin/ABP280 repeat domain-containing protein n=1 Tax=Parapedobacter sp. TaxID=1958893 RepID=UPI002C5C1FCD